MKTCPSCGRHYTAAEWDALPCRGVDASAPGMQFDVRNCSCHSTMYVPLFPFDAEATADFLEPEAA